MGKNYVQKFCNQKEKQFMAILNIQNGKRHKTSLSYISTLYLSVPEVLALKIKSDPDIKSININANEINSFSMQFVDSSCER